MHVIVHVFKAITVIQDYRELVHLHMVSIIQRFDGNQGMKKLVHILILHTCTLAMFV